MNYRHAYHAGNFADVLKHVVLAHVITHLKRKARPFRVIDTHAGVGLYDLSSEAAEKTGEWRDGVGRLGIDGLSTFASTPGAEKQSVGSPALQALLGPYKAALQGALGLAGDLTTGGDASMAYPGSPMIAAALLRATDKLIANELHPEDRYELAMTLKRVTQAKVMGLNGYTALKALLPPSERRGAILIDPPFEEPGELDRMVDGLRQGLKRFASGTFILWYPIKAMAPVDAFKAKVVEMTSCDVLFAELYLRAPTDPDRLNGCGVGIANPPFQLDGVLRDGLPELIDVLSDEAGRTATVRLSTGGG
ncbi:MAG: 23S rRNA (adenine(2030)-N(6))-methyltransferase RlmJ [Pseudomonadota bacterium]